MVIKSLDDHARDDFGRVVNLYLLGGTMLGQWARGPSGHSVGQCLEKEG